jgi:hypothetical protein
MTANTSPIFTATADVANDHGTTFGGSITTATADFTGQSANHVLVHTAGSNGSYVRKLRFKALGTNVATVARIYLNNGSTNATAANNQLLGELALPTTTSANAAVTSQDLEYPLEIALPSGFRIYVGLGTTVAAGYHCTAIAGQY